MATGIIGIIAILIAIGLFLRYGRDTVSILGVGGNQINRAISTLSLSQFPGNA